jgi:SAM-dependent methyltransferase
MENAPTDRARWDPYAAEFAEHAEHGAFNALYDRPAVLGLLGDVSGQRVLDAGCGPGLYAGELAAWLAGPLLAAAADPDLRRIRRGGFLDRATGRAAARSGDGAGLPARSREAARRARIRHVQAGQSA